MGLPWFMAFMTWASSPSVFCKLLVWGCCGLGGNCYYYGCWWDYCCCRMWDESCYNISSWAYGALGCCLEIVLGFWKVCYGGTLGFPSWFKALVNSSFCYLFPFINWLISGFERTALNCYYTIGVCKFLRTCSKFTLFPELFVYNGLYWSNYPGCWILEAPPCGMT